MENFWSKFNRRRPAYALAPLAGITDSAFRLICKDFGADILYSEMISAAALFYRDKKTLGLLRFDPAERPFVVQLFGAEAEHFRAAAAFVSTRIKPDGIDINFGCPAPKVVKQGAGIALFRDKKRSRAAIQAVLAAAEQPVSIKTRSRVGDTGILSFLDNISDLDVKAVMIHGRAGNAGFSGPVDADIIRQARGCFGGKIIANGGVSDRAGARDLLARSEADGIGIGQGALGRPWIFRSFAAGPERPFGREAVFKTAREHAELAYKLKGRAGVIEMRKHLSWYVKGLPDAGHLRQQLLAVEKLGDIARILAG